MGRRRGQGDRLGGLVVEVGRSAEKPVSQLAAQRGLHQGDDSAAGKDDDQHAAEAAALLGTHRLSESLGGIREALARSDRRVAGTLLTTLGQALADISEDHGGALGGMAQRSADFSPAVRSTGVATRCAFCAAETARSANTDAASPTTSAARDPALERSRSITADFDLRPNIARPPLAPIAD